MNYKIKRLKPLTETQSELFQDLRDANAENVEQIYLAVSKHAPVVFHNIELQLLTSKIIYDRAVVIAIAITTMEVNQAVLLANYAAHRHIELMQLKLTFRSFCNDIVPNGIPVFEIEKG